MSQPGPPTPIDYACDAIEEYYNRACNVINSTFDTLRLEERWEAVKLFLHDHPLISLFILILFAVCTFPVLCFTAFAIGSMAFMFITFVFFEGVVLSVGLCVLVAVLFGLTFVALGISVFVAGTGYMFIVAHRVANSIFLLLQPNSFPRSHSHSHSHQRKSSRQRSRRVSPESLGPQDSVVTSNQPPNYLSTSNLSTNNLSTNNQYSDSQSSVLQSTNGCKNK